MWFLDTGYLIALFSDKDTFHSKAVALREKALASQQILITTEAVLFEVGAVFSKVANRNLGAQLIRSLLNDPAIKVLEPTVERRDKAIALFTDRPDKDWSLCNCLSFVALMLLVEQVL